MKTKEELKDLKEEVNTAMKIVEQTEDELNQVSGGTDEPQTCPYGKTCADGACMSINNGKVCNTTYTPSSPKNFPKIYCKVYNQFVGNGSVIDVVR